MNQSQRWPERMITAKDKTVRCPSANCLHPASVGFDPGGARIVKVSAMNCAPEICVKFEVGTAPFTAHGAKHRLKMLLRFGVRSVECIPGAVSPAAKRHAIGPQRLSFSVSHKPIRMLLEQMRFFFGDKRCYPDGRLESACPNLFQNSLHVTAKSRSGFEPVAHCRLVTVVDLNVLKLGRVRGDKVQVVPHVLRSDARSEEIPRTPAGRRRLAEDWRMVRRKAPGQFSQELFAI